MNLRARPNPKHDPAAAPDEAPLQATPPRPARCELSVDDALTRLLARSLDETSASVAWINGASAPGGLLSLARGALGDALKRWLKVAGVALLLSIFTWEPVIFFILWLLMGVLLALADVGRLSAARRAHPEPSPRGALLDLHLALHARCAALIDDAGPVTLDAPDARALRLTWPLRGGDRLHAAAAWDASGDALLLTLTLLTPAASSDAPGDTAHWTLDPTAPDLEAPLVWLCAQRPAPRAALTLEASSRAPSPPPDRLESRTRAFALWPAPDASRDAARARHARVQARQARAGLRVAGFALAISGLAVALSLLGAVGLYRLHRALPLVLVPLLLFVVVVAVEHGLRALRNPFAAPSAPSRPAALRVSRGCLRVSGAVIDLLHPFALQLTRAPDEDTVALSLRQDGERLDLRLPVAPGADAREQLAPYDQRAPLVAPVDTPALWDLVRAVAHEHGATTTTTRWVIAAPEGAADADHAPSFLR